MMLDTENDFSSPLFIFERRVIILLCRNSLSLV